MPSAKPEDSLIGFLQWWNQFSWIHPPSSTCLGGLNGVIIAVLALGKLLKNLQCALDADLASIQQAPTYVKPDYFSEKDLNRAQKLMEQLAGELYSSQQFAASNVHERHQSFIDWQSQAQHPDMEAFPDHLTIKVPTAPEWSSQVSSPVIGPTVYQTGEHNDSDLQLLEELCEQVPNSE